MLNLRFTAYDPNRKSSGRICCDAQHSPGRNDVVGSGCGTPPDTLGAKCNGAIS
jgi:hypothetical protein